jgi:transposase
MMGKPNTIEPKLFYHGLSLDRRIGQDHPLRKVKKLIDFTFVRKEVECLYGKNGNESVDPAVVLKLIFLLFYEDIKSERALAFQLPLRLDWLWFCDYDIDDVTPNHSVISKARSRWGIDVFTRFFENVLGQCIEAGLIDGRTIHVDSGVINANAGKDGLRPKLELLGRQLYQKLEGQEDKQAESNSDKPGTLITEVDPDARLFTKNGKTTLGYKDHRVIDDAVGIITATVTTAANIHDDKVFTKAVQEHIANTGIKPDKAVADKGYGFVENYSWLHSEGILPCIPHRDFSINPKSKISKSEFAYDSRNDWYICPAGQKLYRYDHQRPYQNNSYRYRAKDDVCRQCRFLDKCVCSKTKGRQISRNICAEYIEWADECLSKYERRRLLGRRKYKAEGSFADAANNHHHKRARWRGIVKMRIQNLMIAAVQNLRKLLGFLGCGGVFGKMQRALSADSILIFVRICLRAGRMLVEQTNITF